MKIKLNRNDMENVAKFHEAIINAISNLPHEMLSSNRCGAWVVTALMNILCGVLGMMKFNKSQIYKLIDDIWDNQGMTHKILN